MGVFKKIDVEILIIYKILITVCAINFEILFRQNNNDMANHLSGIFAKLNLERNCPIIEKNILCLKYFMFKIF